jgi:hypothetical protein
MNTCFIDDSYAGCVISWVEFFGFLFFLHLAMGTVQYYLTLKVKGENPKMALIPILSFYNLFKLSWVSLSSLTVPLVFITLCGLGYFIRFLDDGMISLEKMFSFILFSIGLPFWIIYLLIQIIKWILRTAHYRWKFGVLLFLLFWPIFLAYLALTYDEILWAYAPPLPSQPNWSENPQISQSYAEQNDAAITINPTQTSTANSNPTYKTSPSNDSDIGKAVVGFVGIIWILWMIAFVVFALFVLCILGWPAVCAIPGFWH